MDVAEMFRHASHCCILHGCKYGEAECPVLHAQIPQVSTCDTCDGGSWQMFRHQTTAYRLYRADGSIEVITQQQAIVVMFDRRAYGHHPEVERMEEQITSPWRDVPLDVSSGQMSP